MKMRMSKRKRVGAETSRGAVRYLADRDNSETANRHGLFVPARQTQRTRRRGMAGVSLHIVGRVHPTFRIRPHTPTPTSAGYQELGSVQYKQQKEIRSRRC
jgi:hypothetical protein